MTNAYDYVFKIVFVGDLGVGKTSILKKYFENKFNIDIKSTIGVDFFRDSDDGKKICYHYLDTSGNENYRNISECYYKEADVIVIVYDVTNAKSFNSIIYWLENLRENNPSIFIVGNKIESKNRKITESSGINVAKKYECFFIEVSAKSGDNIEELFEKIKNVLFKPK